MQLQLRCTRTLSGGSHDHFPGADHTEPGCRLVEPTKIRVAQRDLGLPGEDLTIIAYTAVAGSAAEEKLAILASWQRTIVSAAT